MPKSDLLEYKWANLESFFETPKFVQCMEMAGTREARAHFPRLGKYSFLGF
jgi:hypothetical protein